MAEVFTIYKYPYIFNYCTILRWLLKVAVLAEEIVYSRTKWTEEKYIKQVIISTGSGLSSGVFGYGQYFFFGIFEWHCLKISLGYTKNETRTGFPRRRIQWRRRRHHTLSVTLTCCNGGYWGKTLINCYGSAIPGLIAEIPHDPLWLYLIASGVNYCQTYTFY